MEGNTAKILLKFPKAFFCSDYCFYNIEAKHTFGHEDKDDILARLNIRVRYHNRLLSFHLTSKFREGQYFYVKVVSELLAVLLTN